MRHFLIVVLVGLLTGPSVVLAQTGPQPIDVKDKRWVHEPTGIRLESKIGDFTRGAMTDLSGGQLADVMTQYARGSDQATVYIYHAATPAAPLWFDIARKTIFLKTNVGTINSTEMPPNRFALPNNPVLAGLEQSFPVTGMARSTGLAVVELGEWVIKFRMSSTALSPSELESLLMQFIQQMGWPKKLPPMQEAIALNNCENPMAFDAAAKIADETNASILGAALSPAAQVAEGEKLLKSGKPLKFPALCVHPDRAAGGFYVYQFAETRNGFIIPLGDSGRVLAVHADPVSTELREDKKPVYRVTFQTHTQHTQFSAFLSVPSPDLALDVVRSGPALSQSGVFGSQRQVSINAAAMKEQAPATP